MPTPIYEHLLGRLLTHCFQRELSSGQLDFLNHRRVAIEVPDLAIQFSVTREADTLRVIRQRNRSADADVCIAGNHEALLQLITGIKDPDTLFFRRQLRMTGNTALGLTLKNLMDTLEPETRIPPTLYRAMTTYLVAPGTAIAP